MAENPFAAIESPVVIPDKKPEMSAVVTGASKKDMFVFDFETIPDESRYPQPEKIAVPSRPVIKDDPDFDAAKILKQAVPAIKKSVEKCSDNELTLLLETEGGAPKPRKGVTDAINAALSTDDEAIAKTAKANADALAAWRKEGSVNPLKARIVAFGWAYRGGKVQSLVARNDDEERIILEQFWTLIKTTRRRCGYNIFHFDDLLAIVRSLILGVAVPRPLDRRKYGNREAIDLMVALFPSGSPQKCKDVVQLLGITPPAGDVEGSQVYSLYEANDMKAIAEYVESDVYVERELYLLLADVLSM